MPQLEARLSKAGPNFWQRFAGDKRAEKEAQADAWLSSIGTRMSNLSKATTAEKAQSIANGIASALSSKGLASGGIASGGNMHLVGERGPELFLPQKSGLVLNNSISSRLMGMMSGTSSGSGSNVVININNPTVRNDADIRKLTEQITKAQVSMYRSQGGRLI
jgi:hypothetical protein